MTARPVRTCVGCRQRFAIEHLVRITFDGPGHLVVGGPSHGRGVWLCRGSRVCVASAGRAGAIARGLRVQVTSEQERWLAERLLDGFEKWSAASGPSTAVS